MNRNKFKKLLLHNQLLESSFCDLKKYSFFLKKYTYNFGLYNYKVIFKEVKLLLYILNRIKSKGGIILFVGLTKEDYFDYISFNKSLKKLVISQGHIYADSQFKGFFYNYWSLYKRRSNPSDFFLTLHKNNKCPSILLSFSKETDDAIYKEVSKFGIPVVYLLEGYSKFRYKDYPLIGTYCGKMLNFYFSLLKYSLKYV